LQAHTQTNLFHALYAALWKQKNRCLWQAALQKVRVCHLIAHQDRHVQQQVHSAADAVEWIRFCIRIIYAFCVYNSAGFNPHKNQSIPALAGLDYSAGNIPSLPEDIEIIPSIT
jgi:hypothetical protein